MLFASRNYYTIFSPSNLSGKLTRGRGREKGRKKGTEKEGKRGKRGQEQEITERRRVSGAPPRKNGIFISILSDTEKNEASWKARKESGRRHDPF